MMVVAIIGILAAVAIPSVMQYVRKAKTAEATHNLRFIHEGARAYLAVDWAAKDTGEQLNHQFPDTAGPTPLLPCCFGTGQKCPAAESVAEFGASPTWVALKFGMNDEHYYRYEFVSSGSATTGVGSWFTARASGDLDCDGISSTFETYGKYGANQEDMESSGGFYSSSDTE
jgi:type II secretory pathway pseudopilin PulG